MATTLLRTQTEQTPAHEARENLAFLLPRLISLHDTLALQREISDSADLAQNIGTQAIKPTIELNLMDRLEELSTTIKQEPGTLWIALPKWLNKYTQAEPLIKDYGQEKDEISEGSHQLLAIPSRKITAAHSLPLLTADIGYEPSLDLRIQTSQDQPLRIYVGAGKTENTPSPGRWHRFPLGQVAIMLAAA